MEEKTSAQEILYDVCTTRLMSNSERGPDLLQELYADAPEMFDEVLARVSPRITKEHTAYREPLELGLKHAFTLRHFASDKSMFR